MVYWGTLRRVWPEGWGETFFFLYLLLGGGPIWFIGSSFELSSLRGKKVLESKATKMQRGLEHLYEEKRLSHLWLFSKYRADWGASAHCI